MPKTGHSDVSGHDDAYKPSLKDIELAVATLKDEIGPTYDFVRFREFVSANPVTRYLLKDYALGTDSQMVPLGALASITYTQGAATVSRYNLYPTVGLNGAAAPGFSSGQAMDLMAQAAADKLPANVGLCRRRRCDTDAAKRRRTGELTRKPSKERLPCPRDRAYSTEEGAVA